MYQSFIKPCLDISVAIIAFLLLSPIFLSVLLILLVVNNGKPFFLQQRPGYKEKIFKIIKFKTMNDKKDSNGELLSPDKRLTKFGLFIRKRSLDEIPQFYNVLKGDMSIIGPRPERPEFVSNLEEQIPFYAIRHAIRPGLTGWAQVNYPYANTIEEQETKLRYDLYYIKERNSFLDFKILIKTITTILFFRGQ